MSKSEPRIGTVYQELFAFLKQVARTIPTTAPELKLHLVMDNYATHKRAEVRDWLTANLIQGISLRPRG